jgi:hypothetical protein
MVTHHERQSPGAPGARMRLKLALVALTLGGGVFLVFYHQVGRV